MFKHAGFSVKGKPLGIFLYIRRFLAPSRLRKKRCRMGALTRTAIGITNETERKNRKDKGNKETKKGE